MESRTPAMYSADGTTRWWASTNQFSPSAERRVSVLKPWLLSFDVQSFVQNF